MGKKRNFAPLVNCWTFAKRLSLLCKFVPDVSLWLRADENALQFFVAALLEK